LTLEPSVAQNARGYSSLLGCCEPPRAESRPSLRPTPRLTICRKRNLKSSRCFPTGDIHADCGEWRVRAHLDACCVHDEWRLQVLL